MKRNILSKPVFLITLILVGSIHLWSQAILPFAYDSGNPGTSVTELSQSGLGTDYLTSPKLKFDNEQDYLILNFSGVPGSLSFKIKWNQGPSAPARFSGSFILLESVDGINYTIVQLYNATNGTPLKNAVTVTETFKNLSPATRYIKWIYASKTNGNIGIGDLSLNSGKTPILNVSTNVLNELNYFIGSGPSQEQSFTVGGSLLYDNILVTPPVNYEISKSTGKSFIATNPVALIQTSGNIASTVVYIRLKQGLSVGNYPGSVSVKSVNASPFSVACNGKVTSNPTFIVTDITNLTLNTTRGTPVSQTINVSGANLSADVKFALSGVDAGLFSLSQYSVNLNFGTAPNSILTITYTPLSIGTNTAELIITSTGAMPVTRTLYGNSTISTETNSLKSTLISTVVNGRVFFMAHAGDSLEIYDAIGQKLLQKKAEEGVNEIHLNFHGVLLVRIGKIVTKVIL